MEYIRHNTIYMRTLLLLLLIMLQMAPARANDTSGFTAPDYKKIEKETSDKNSPYYYPTLMKRFKANDTSLGITEFQMLYYGRFFQKDSRSVFYHSPILDSTRELRKKESLTGADRVRLAGFYEQILDETPMALGTIVSLATQYRYLNDARASYYSFKVNGIMDVIMSTGDGVSQGTAMHIGSIDDEYVVLALLGFEFGGSQSLTDGPCDLLAVSDNKYGIKGLYFNVGQIMAEEARLLGESLNAPADTKKPGKKAGKKK